MNKPKPKKRYYLQDQYGETAVIPAVSPRLAVLAHKARHAIPGRLFLIRQDGADGRVYDVGYGVGRFWYQIAELTPMRRLSR